MSLDYHFSVEQEVGSSAYGFFGFNGMYNINTLEIVQREWHSYEFHALHPTLEFL